MTEQVVIGFALVVLAGLLNGSFAITMVTAETTAGVHALNSN